MRDRPAKSPSHSHRRVPNSAPKLRARVADDPSRIVSALDDHDWAFVTTKPKPRLICPTPGCNTRLNPRSQPSNRHHPRYFYVLTGERDCGHNDPPRSTGGRESQRHLWMKSRLVQTARNLGHEAIEETSLGATRPDITLAGSGWCFEVQQHHTSISERTRRIVGLSHNVCWFIPSDAPERLRNQAFRHPAILFSVVRSDSDRRPATPWIDGEPAIVLVHGARRDIRAQGDDLVEQGGGLVPLELFVEELVRDGRRWYDARTDECARCRQVHKPGWLRPADHDLAIQSKRPSAPAAIEQPPRRASVAPMAPPAPAPRRRRWWWPFSRLH